MSTVKDLKEILSELPDDMPVKVAVRVTSCWENWVEFHPLDMGKNATIGEDMPGDPMTLLLGAD